MTTLEPNVRKAGRANGPMTERQCTPERLALVARATRRTPDDGHWLSYWTSGTAVQMYQVHKRWENLTEQPMAGYQVTRQAWWALRRRQRNEARQAGGS